MSAIIEAICQTYHLGKNLKPPVLCTGGLLHQNWKIETTKGVFFIKILNPSIINRPGSYERFIVTDHIACHMKQYVPAVSALTYDDRLIYTFENQHVMVFPFVDGYTILDANIHKNHLKQISNSLKKIHDNNVQIGNAPTVEILNNDFLAKFEEYMTQLCFHPIGQQCEINYKFIRSLYENYQIYRDILQTDLVISHRDLDPKNVMWGKNNQCIIVDWESAGLINKIRDAVTTAIYWSLNKDFQLNAEFFNYFLQHYQQNDISAEQLMAGCYGLIGDWLTWLNFNLSRTLNHTSGTDEFMLGISEASNTLNALPIVYTQLQNL